MTKEHGYSQISTRLGLAIFAFTVLTGCTKVVLECPPSAAIKENTRPPTGGACPLDSDGNCKPKKGCTCM